MEAILEKGGYRVHTASNGLEAQEKIATNEYDIAIIDLRMPVMDGHALLAWIREHAPQTVSIVLSSTPSAEEALRAVQAGAYDFLTKPISSSHMLLHVVERAEKHRRLLVGREQLLEDLQQKTAELENRFGQLETAYSVLQSQAAALQHDIDRAMRIQSSLLPHEVPFPERLSVGALYCPPGKVGGDLFDLFQIGDRHLAFYLADISGHGISSAMMSVFLKQSLHRPRKSDTVHPMLSPCRVLQGINQRILAASLGHGMFVSAVYFVVDTQTFEVSYASAGHPPALLKRANGCVETLNLPSPALGICPAYTYPHETFQMQEGDTLVAYTDGTTNVCDSHGEVFGEYRLQECIRAAGISPM